MKNLPSFNDFKKYESLIESVDRDLASEFNLLEGAEPYHTVNEGIFGDWVKNSLSKFFLGSLSRVGMIDKARKLLVDLEIDAIEKRADFEKSVEDLESQLDGLNSINDKQKILAIEKDRDAKIREHEAFLKSHTQKVRKAKDFVEKVIDGNQRRRDYYEAGRADDEIALAELEYKLAKDKADQSELKKYEETIKAKQRERDQKMEDLKDKMENTGDGDSPDGKGTGDPAPEDLSLDPEKEKKKVSTRKGKDIIERKKELEKDIADLRSDIERKLELIKKKVSSKAGVTPKYLENSRIELLEISSALDSKVNLLRALRELGKTESDIEGKLKKESEFTKLADKINAGIMDGEDANSGTKKIISDLFVTTGGKILTDPSKIKLAMDKLNK